MYTQPSVQFSLTIVLLPIYVIWLCLLLLSSTLAMEEEKDSVYPFLIHAGGDLGVYISSESGCQVIIPSLKLRLNPKMKFQSYRISDAQLKGIITLCQDYQKELISPTQLVWSLREQTRFIYPGTKYCGTGNSSSGVEDLGVYVETDKCCREHDSCQDYVLGFSCHPENGLCNNTPFTRSSCDCDEKFRQCLLTANEVISIRIGKLFFNVFGLKCYRVDHPILQCEAYGGFLNIHCQKYALDYTKSPTLQFFDSPQFIPFNSYGEDYLAGQDVDLTIYFGSPYMFAGKK